VLYLAFLATAQFMEQEFVKEFKPNEYKDDKPMLRDDNDFTIALVYDKRRKSVQLKSVFERAFDLYKKKMFFAKR